MKMITAAELLQATKEGKMKWYSSNQRTVIYRSSIFTKIYFEIQLVRVWWFWARLVVISVRATSDGHEYVQVMASGQEAQDLFKAVDDLHQIQRQKEMDEAILETRKQLEIADQ